MGKDTAGNKKRLIVSYHNLPIELQEELKRQYPGGYTDKMLRIEKGLLETPDINYLVKVDVKIDDDVEEEEDKGYYDDEIKGAEEIVADDDDDDDEGM